VGSWTAIDWVITGVLVPLVGMIIWVIKRIVSYYLDPNGVLDRVSKARERMFVAWESYMESSKTIQAATAGRLTEHAAQLAVHVEHMVRHDTAVIEKTVAAGKCLEVIVATQEEHGQHLRTLVAVGTEACDVALTVCRQLELGPENAVAVEKIKETLKVKGGSGN